MKRSLLARIVIAGGLLALAPSAVLASEYPIGFWRYMGYGLGPGYHAHNCCAGPCGPRRGHRPHIQPWHPHLTENGANTVEQPQLVQSQPAPQSVVKRSTVYDAPRQRTADHSPAKRSALKKYFAW